MSSDWRIGITLAVVALFAVLWVVDDRLSRRPAYRRKMRLWQERLIERRRAQGLRRPTFVIWVLSSGVVLLALLWSVR